METKDVVQTLSTIPIGTIIAWIAVLSSIITVVATGTVKLYKIFEKTKTMQEDNDAFREMVKNHDTQLKLIKESLDTINVKLDKRDKAELTKLRHEITCAGEEYVSKGEITIRQLRALEEMFEEYRNNKGNGYVATLMDKVESLPVVGMLDENDQDVIN